MWTGAWLLGRYRQWSGYPTPLESLTSVCPRMHFEKSGSNDRVNDVDPTITHKGK